MQVRVTPLVSNRLLENQRQILSLMEHFSLFKLDCQVQEEEQFFEVEVYWNEMNFFSFSTRILLSKDYWVEAIFSQLFCSPL